MATPEIVIPEFVSMKGHPDLNEKWLQHHLTKHPGLLQLGDELEVLKTEHTQPTGGRLDLLLQDSESGTRYEVEIQLGAVDESHIIRTIEYWDVERRRYPRYDHIAVIVAEDVTSRFLNVISLFNRTIPLIAIQLKAVEVKGSLTLIATRVIDLMPLGTEEDEPQETADRKYWEQRASKESLRVVDQLLQLIQEMEIKVVPNYNRRYIGLRVDGSVRNFVSFLPRKSQFAIGLFKIPRSERLDAEIEEAGLDTMHYRQRFGQYQIRLTEPDIRQHEQLLRKLMDTAYRAHPFT